MVFGSTSRGFRGVLHHQDTHKGLVLKEEFAEATSTGQDNQVINENAERRIFQTILTSRMDFRYHIEIEVVRQSHNNSRVIYETCEKVHSWYKVESHNEIYDMYT